MLTVNPNDYMTIFIPIENSDPEFHIDVGIKYLDRELYVDINSVVEILEIYDDKKSYRVDWKKFCKIFKNEMKNNSDIVDNILCFYNSLERERIRNKYRKAIPDFIPLDLLNKLINKNDKRQSKILLELYNHRLYLQYKNLVNWPLSIYKLYLMKKEQKEMF